MPNYNKVILIGHLTRDPELRFTANGKAIAKIGIAVSRQWKDEAGTKKEDTAFVDVDAFGKQAETLGQYLKKGRALMVEGRLKMDQWEDKQSGQKRSKLGVVLESFQFIGGQEKEESKRPPEKQDDLPDMPPPSPKDKSDDVPF